MTATHPPVGTLLQEHARTFALTLRFLPPELGDPLGLAYLLARISDTVADAAGIPRERRLGLLACLAGDLAAGEPERWSPEILSGELSIPELELVTALPRLLAALERLPDRPEVLRLWGTILEGQLFDLQRFHPGAAALSRVELERYCLLVAGSVGESWTRLIAAHAPAVMTLPLEEMTACAVAYGKGLQLTNILRDRAADRLLGRVYAREGELPALLDLAEAWLREGERYVLHLHGGRIRYASQLPLALARRTLLRIRRDPAAPRSRVPRREVYGVLFLSLPSLWLPGRVNPAS